MDRRTFVQASLSAFLTYNCSCARARAVTTLHGCRMAASEGPLGVRLVKGKEFGLDQSRGSSFSYTVELGKENLRVNPGLAFFDDGKHPNAFAYPGMLSIGERSFLIRDGTDGTVLMGVNLWKDQEKKVDQSVLCGTIFAHEYGHILQYKRGMTPAGPWQMEPHADFLAGWSMGRWPESSSFWSLRNTPEFNVELSVKSFFDRGDYAFNEPTHHGEPEFRAAMIRAGYELDYLDLDQAFEKGKKLAGLN